MREVTQHNINLNPVPYQRVMDLVAVRRRNITCDVLTYKTIFSQVPYSLTLHCRDTKWTG
jgi:hypothetical protein